MTIWLWMSWQRVVSSFSKLNIFRLNFKVYQIFFIYFKSQQLWISSTATESLSSIALLPGNNALLLQITAIRHSDQTKAFLDVNSQLPPPPPPSHMRHRRLSADEIRGTSCQSEERRRDKLIEVQIGCENCLQSSFVSVTISQATWKEA